MTMTDQGKQPGTPITSTPAPSRAPRKKSNTTQHKVISASLAGAACVGLVGVIGVRVTADANAQQSKQVDAATLAAATSSTGMTQDQLDQYAAKLEAERQKLIAYRDQLVQVANVLQSRSGSIQQTALTQSAPQVANAQASTKLTKAQKKAAKKAAAAKAAAQAQQQAQAQQAPQQAAPQAQRAPQLQPQRQYQQAPQSNTRGS